MLNTLQTTRLRNRLTTEANGELPGVFSVLGDPGRYKIFRLLMENDGVLCVTEMANIFEVSVPAASQQLKVMEMHGLVLRERDGQRICYCLNKDNPVVKKIINFIKTI